MVKASVDVNFVCSHILKIAIISFLNEDLIQTLHKNLQQQPFHTTFLALMVWQPHPTRDQAVGCGLPHHIGLKSFKISLFLFSGSQQRRVPKLL
jgi:hypothetical protein